MWKGEESQNTRASFRCKEGCSIVGFTLIINVRDQGGRRFKFSLPTNQNPLKINDFNAPVRMRKFRRSFCVISSAQLQTNHVPGFPCPLALHDDLQTTAALRLLCTYKVHSVICSESFFARPGFHDPGES